jgi:hypothetical protein
MKPCCLLPALLLGLSSAALAGGSFVYRGELIDADVPAEGDYGFRVALHAHSSSARSLIESLELRGVRVSGGRFEIPVELHGLPPLLDTAWLEVSVQAPGENVWWPLPGRSAVSLKAAVCPTSWELAGNLGTDPAQDFLGTVDDRDLVLRANGERLLRLSPPRFAPVPDELAGPNVLAGHAGNALGPGVVAATIAGGGGVDFGVLRPNVVEGFAGTVAGGTGNTAGGGLPGPVNSAWGSVGGGRNNLASHLFSTVGGGFDNRAGNDAGVVGGGRGNRALGPESTVGGGIQNEAGGLRSTVGGGRENRASGESATVSGGDQNQAAANFASVGGGTSNRAAGNASTVAGGFGNEALGFGSVVAGGDANCAGGSYSWAGGQAGKVRPPADPGFGSCSNLPSYSGVEGDAGTFIWAGVGDDDFVSTGPNQFLVRAANGFGLNTANPTPSHLTIGKDDGSNNLVALGFQGNVTRWRIGGPLASVPGSAFEVQSGGNRVLMRVEDRAPGARVGISRTATANALEVEGDASKSTAGSWLANSDARIKTEVREIEDALARLMRLRPVTFRYREDYRKAHPGVGEGVYYNVIAQEFAEVFPDAVKSSGERLPAAGGGKEDEILQVDLHPALITLLAGVQELAVRLETAESENALLRAQLAGLQSTQAQALADIQAQLAQLRREQFAAAVAGER